jgi:sulfoxide reductase heme-binding subunit YedZ
MAARTLKDRLIFWTVQLACAAPLFIFVGQAFTDGLTANPIQYVLRQLGVWALRLLVIGLAVTPAARLLRMPGLIRYRRPIGLWAFAWGTIGKDILKRPYITIGMAAFALLIPLAVTSTNAMLRRLGPRRWRRLQQLIYLIVPMGVLHYYLLVKADHRPPLIYGALVLALLAYRFVSWRLDRRRAATRKAARSAASQTVRA